MAEECPEEDFEADREADEELALRDEVLADETTLECAEDVLGPVLEVVEEPVLCEEGFTDEALLR